MSLFAVPRCLASAQAETRNARQEVEIIYGRMADADNSRDFLKIEEAFINLLSPDFTLKTVDGNKIDLKHEIAIIKSNLMGIVSNDVSYEIACLSVNGPDASVIVVTKSSGIVKDATGLFSHIDQGVMTRDNWTRNAGGWKLRNIEQLKELYLFIDGRPNRKNDRK